MAFVKLGRLGRGAREERGAIAAEYGLILGLIALAIVAAAALFGGQVLRLIQAGADAF